MSLGVWKTVSGFLFMFLITGGKIKEKLNHLFIFNTEVNIDALIQPTYIHRRKEGTAVDGGVSPKQQWVLTRPFPFSA